MIYRVVIGGCRNFNNYTYFKKYVDIYLTNIKIYADIVILSGHCTGTDSMAERYAKENNYSLEVHPAQWHKFGRSAGPMRNKQMVQQCDFVIAFWDGISKGTKNLIDNATKFGKPLRIKRIEKPLV